MNKYINKKAIKGPWKFHDFPKESFYHFIIVIPAFKEGNNINSTLKSIALQDNELQKILLVIIVINNSEKHDEKILKENHLTFQTVSKFKCQFEIVIINAFSDLPLPEKHAGVGLARKIGFDLALPYSNQDTILCSLDADTVISLDYLKILDTYFIKNKKKEYCIIPGIKHQSSINLKIEKAIFYYEKFLYSTAKNIKLAGSPYGFITMGSAMAFNSSCYMKAGGFSRKKVTEDFYFLQEVAKTGFIESIPEVLVFPSARISDRVYLGTGFRMLQASKGKNLNNLYYKKEAFKILRLWLKIGENGFEKSVEEILLNTKKINPQLTEFIKKNNIQKIWNGLQNSCNNKEKFKKQFHCWFDGLKTFRLLKYFSTDLSSFSR